MARSDESIRDSLRRPLLTTDNVKCTRVDAAVPADAQNAPTGTWKTAQNAVSHSAHTHHWFVRREGTKDDHASHTEFLTLPEISRNRANSLCLHPNPSAMLRHTEFTASSVWEWSLKSRAKGSRSVSLNTRTRN